MVVAGILALALALPTGALFGIGYGTGVRIGYEQVYPLLFPKGQRPDSGTTVENIKQINKIYDTVGGKEASQMGIAQGILSAKALTDNPDFQALGELESKLSGLTSLRAENVKLLEASSSLLQESLANRNTRGLSDYTDVTITNPQPPPGGILEHNPFLTTGPTIEGPENIGNTYGYASMSRGQLLDNQPSQKHPNDSDELHRKRQVEWDFYFDKIKAQDAANQSSALNKTSAQHTTTTGNIYRDNPEIATYIVKRGELITQMYWANQTLQTAVRANATAPATTNSSSGKNKFRLIREQAVAERKFTAAQKAIMTHITHARNVGFTKSLANSDWNNRIWKL